MSSPIDSSQWMYNAGGDFYDYPINQSLRFEDGDSPALSKEYSTAQTNTKKLTISVWVKRGNLGIRSTILFAKSGSAGKLSFQTTDKIYFNAFNTGYNGFESTELFRDTSSWFHILAQADSADQSGANVNRVYVNGVELANGKTSVFVPDDTATMLLRNGVTTYIGDDTAGAYHFDGYLAEMHVVDGSIVAPASFAETIGGVWIPKDYTGAHGDNGFYLPFDDSSAIGDDESANTNDFTVANLSGANDIVFDSPTNNFATFNPLNLPAAAVLSEGNLKLTQTSNDRAAIGNMAISSGKWYYEVHYTAGSNPEAGLARVQDSFANSGATGSSDKFLYITNATTFRTPAWTATDNTNVSAQTSETILGFAVDADNGKAFISVNGTYINSGDPAAGSNPQATFDADWVTQTGGGIVPFIGVYTSTSAVVKINFGQDSSFSGAKTVQGNADGGGIGDFFYAPPSGFLALCSANLPEPTIGPNSKTQADDHFNTVLYTGNGSSRSITGIGFSPAKVWTKERNSTSYHEIHDIVRGASKQIFPNATDAEESTAKLTAFGDDGFSLAAHNSINENGKTYVSWNWKAGTAFSNDASATSVGSIDSEGRVNTTSGFSVVKFTTDGETSGTVAHGLTDSDGNGIQPQLLIGKTRNHAVSWYVQTPLLATNLAGILNATDAFYNPGYNHWNDTHPTTSVFSVGGYMADHSDLTNPSTKIVYCFANVEGYQKIGVYEGNGNANGAFVYTGFRPAFLLAKSVDSTSSWYIFDNKREGYNVDNDSLLADTSGTETTTDMVDLLSNGFKLRRGADPNIAETFVYLAIADQPFKYANAR